MESRYRSLIAGFAGPGVDPRHIEGFMRLQYGTLDHLDPATFKEEVSIGIDCIKAVGTEEAETNAQSFGL